MVSRCMSPTSTSMKAMPRQLKYTADKTVFFNVPWWRLVITQAGITIVSRTKIVVKTSVNFSKSKPRS